MQNKANFKIPQIRWQAIKGVPVIIPGLIKSANGMPDNEYLLWDNQVKVLPLVPGICSSVLRFCLEWKNLIQNVYQLAVEFWPGACGHLRQKDASQFTVKIDPTHGSAASGVTK